MTDNLSHISGLLGVDSNDPNAVKFVQAMKVLYRDPKFSACPNAIKVLEEVALAGIFPITRHMSYYINQNTIVWMPSARGMVYRASMDGIVKNIECTVVYQPDYIVSVASYLNKIIKLMETNIDAGGRLLDEFKRLTEGSKLDDLIIMRGEGEHIVSDSTLVASVCKVERFDGSHRYDILYARQLIAIREAFSTCKTSKAYTATPWEMHKKSHIKEVIKYELELSGKINTKTETIIDQDNQVNCTVNPQLEAKKVSIEQFRENILKEEATNAVQD